MTLGNPERPVGGLAVRPPQGIELRPLGRADLADAVSLARQLHGQPPLDDVEPLRPRLDALLGSADVVPFLALEGELPIGVGVVQFRRRLNFPSFEGWVSDLFVLQRERGRGVGRALLDALVAEWRLRGAHRLQARAPDGAVAAAELYRAAGLEEWMLDFRLHPLGLPQPAAVDRSFRLRAAEEDDFEAVTALVGQFGAQRVPGPERIDAVRRAYLAQLDMARGGRGAVTVAEADGRVLGVQVVEWQRPFWTGETHAWLPDLIVDETARGRGMGRALLQDAMRHAQAAGATQLSLESGPGRQVAHALYLSSGFAKTGRTWLLRRDAR
jgi:GNAT superfamily N-acetyltransferase